MKLKDLPNNTIVSSVLLKMPDDVFEQAKETGLTTQEVMFAMPYSGPLGYWVKTKETDNRIFPIWDRDPKEVLEWEVIS